MPYRSTERSERSESRRAAIRERFVAAARELIPHGGYREAPAAGVGDLVAFCLRSVTDRRDAHAGAHAA
jgi:hypothetical protein